MRLYYEAQEIVGFEEDSEFIRANVTDMTDKEKEDTLQAIKDVMSGKEYRLTEHICGHDEGLPCTRLERVEVRKLKEV